PYTTLFRSEAADLRLGVHLAGAFLEAPDEKHLLEDGARLVALGQIVTAAGAVAGLLAPLPLGAHGHVARGYDSRRVGGGARTRPRDEHRNHRNHESRERPEQPHRHANARVRAGRAPVLAHARIGAAELGVQTSRVRARMAP